MIRCSFILQYNHIIPSSAGEESVHTILLRTTTFHILSMTYFTMPRLRRNSTDDELFEPLPLPTAAYRNNLQAQQRLMADASSKHHYCSARRASCTALCKFNISIIKSIMFLYLYLYEILLLGGVVQCQPGLVPGISFSEVLKFHVSFCNSTHKGKSSIAIFDVTPNPPFPTESTHL